MQTMKHKLIHKSQPIHKQHVFSNMHPSYMFSRLTNVVIKWFRKSFTQVLIFQVTTDNILSKFRYLLKHSSS